MHKIMKLKENILEELEEYADKKTYSKEDLECIKFMASAVDHMCNIVKGGEEEEYSSRGRSYEGSSRSMRSYDSYDDGSYRRDAMGRYTSRAYSRDADVADRLQEMMRTAPDEHARSDIQRVISMMGNR